MKFVLVIIGIIGLAFAFAAVSTPSFKASLIFRIPDGDGCDAITVDLHHMAWAPPKVWADGAACGGSITVTCKAKAGFDSCSSNPTYPVQIVGLTCTDVESDDCDDEMFFLNEPVFEAIAAPDAKEIYITY